MQTVEKVVRPIQADTNDKCCFCLFQFSVKYGNFGNLARPSEVFQILGKDLQGLWKKSQKNSQLKQPNEKCFV